MCYRQLVTLLAIFLIQAVVGQTTPPSVDIKNGTVIGNTTSGIESFKGIPYAAPPTGNLRLRPPVSVQENFGVFNATGVPTACPQLAGSSTAFPPVLIDTLNNSTGGILGSLLSTAFSSEPVLQGEDCLTLNIQRPAGTASDSKLPVLIWIYGGGFIAGSTQGYDGTPIVTKSVSSNEPIIYVAMNYRLAAFGFLGGKELSDEGSTNLGLRDQRLALQWVQENIAAFGGDPGRVTIWGESAGSWSVTDHLLIENGDNSFGDSSKLFHGAIMNSGATLPAVQVDHAKPQSVFNGIVILTGCDDASDKLACLREVEYEDLLAAQNNYTGAPYPSVNIQFLARPDPANSFFPRSPELAIANASFSSVPMIIGNQEDEGTLFTLGLANITNNASIISLLTTLAPQATNISVQTILGVYPDDPTAGAPYRTSIFNQLYPGFKRISSIIGDLTFIMQRRYMLDDVSPRVKVWSYLATYNHIIPYIGTSHATDILAIYGGISAGTSPTDEILTRYISFVQYGDPNIMGVKSQGAQYTIWPIYDTENRTLLNFEDDGVSTMKDDFRQDAYKVIKNNIGAAAL